jgi:ABC-type amino acid transport substrate-binding protein
MKRALCLAIGLIAAAATVEAAPKLGAYAIPGVFELDKTGSYDKALARVASEAGLSLDYVVLAPGRIEDDFKQHKLDCVIPLDARFWSSTEKVVNSEPLNVAKIYVFSRAGDGPYTSVEQLKGKRVGARRGMPYWAKYDRSGINVELVNDDGQNVQKLNANRIDAFLAYVPDMWQWARDSKQPLPNHDGQQPLAIHKDAFLCRDSAATREFLKAFDAAVVKIRASGELQRILGSAYVP